ncbi:MAG: YbaB/EbfC family nucleoid-associated protein [Flavobacteriales bacterium]|nr:MAG: YbaB/EbfC family nucleoid-associated protein [Flavobacteriales bacterium]
MFGDLKGMMGKLKEAQAKVAATKQRMNTVLIDGNSSDGMLKVTITANRELKNLEIDDGLLENKTQLIESLILTLNKAIDKATTINEREVAAVASEGMPKIPGMDLF